VPSAAVGLLQDHGPNAVSDFRFLCAHNRYIYLHIIIHIRFRFFFRRSSVSVESVGTIAPKRIFLKSVAELKNKAQYLLDALDTITSSSSAMSDQ
jgi:hypothetical protein